MKKCISNILILIFILNLFSILITTTKVQALSSENNLVIVIDPGHGGKQPGVVNGNLIEKDIVLKISKYTQQKLQEYVGVEVYLTHYGLPTDEELAIDERANIAKRFNADLFVSFHINATGDANDTASNGAEVFITRDTSKNKYNENSKKLANIFLQNLNTIGIANRGIKTKIGNTESPNNREYYYDNFEVDYYGVIRYPRKLEIPGILLEHCFIRSQNDIDKINSDEKLKVIGELDAKAIAKQYNLKTKEEVKQDIINPEKTTITSFNVGVKTDYINSKITLDNNFKMKFIDKNSNSISGELGTGCKIQVLDNNNNVIKENTVIILGEVNGDAKISASDYGFVKNHMMETGLLTGEKALAADYNGDGTISASDYVSIKNYIMDK